MKQALWTLPFLIGGLALSSMSVRGQDEAPVDVDLGAMWRKNCAACHTVPDSALRTDRAWLGQVRRTS